MAMVPFTGAQRAGVERWFPGAVVNGSRALVVFGDGYPRAEVRAWRDGTKVRWEAGVADTDGAGGMTWEVRGSGEFSWSTGDGAAEAYSAAVAAWGARHRTPGGAGGRAGGRR